MYRKDLLVKQFEEFGKVLAVILSLKLNKNWDEFEKEINAASLKFTQTEMPELDALSDEAFHETIVNGDKLSLEQKKILACLLFEKMNLFDPEKEAEKFRACGLKSLALYKHLKENHTTNEFDLDVHYKLAALAFLEK